MSATKDHHQYSEDVLTTIWNKINWDEEEATTSEIKTVKESTLQSWKDGDSIEDAANKAKRKLAKVWMQECSADEAHDNEMDASAEWAKSEKKDLDQVWKDSTKGFEDLYGEF